MSLYGMMRTGVSGMNAQANRLSTVADNIANSSTTGYKRSSTEFSTLLMPRASGDYTSGGVNTTVRTSVSQQGDLKFTSQGTDLAVNGDGFFVVSDASGEKISLTRAGSFVPDSQGRLVNAAGFYLMGVTPGSGIATSLNDFTQVKISAEGMEATPTTKGELAFNLPSNAVEGDQHTTSMTTYDTYGNQVKVAVEFTKGAGTDEWTMVATPENGTAVSLPLTFNATTHKLEGTTSPLRFRAAKRLQSILQDRRHWLPTSRCRSSTRMAARQAQSSPLRSARTERSMPITPAVLSSRSIKFNSRP